MSSIFERGMAWHTYVSLEKDFIDFTRYLALDKSNMRAWSEKGAQLLLLTGSTVDSVFNQMRFSKYLPSTRPVADLRQNSMPNIGNYRDVYEEIYRLSGVELSASYGLTNYGLIRPFHPFAPQQSPQWWEAYNDVKHDFFKNMNKGTLDNVVHALGALFTLNILEKGSQQYLLQIGVIGLGSQAIQAYFSPHWWDRWDLLKKSFVGLPKNVGFDVVARSQVFLHVFRKDESIMA